MPSRTGDARSTPEATAQAAGELSQRILRIAFGCVAEAGRGDDRPDHAPAKPGPEAIRSALEDVLLQPDPRGALTRLADHGILQEVLPEVTATRDLREGADRRHKDVWRHTLQVVAQSPARLVVRWAALLHDIGKVSTRSFTPEGGVTFHGHAEAGARLVRRRIRPRLAFPRAMGEEVEFLVRHHLRAAQYDRSWQDSAVRRLARQMDPHTPDLLDLSRADVTSRRPGRRQEALELIDELVARIAEIQARDARPAPLPPGLGHHLMEHFGLAPGPQVGALRRRLDEAVAQGELPPGPSPRECIAYLERISGAG